jgi:hypothetical protein
MISCSCVGSGADALDGPVLTRPDPVGKEPADGAPQFVAAPRVANAAEAEAIAVEYLAGRRMNGGALAVVENVGVLGYRIWFDVPSAGGNGDACRSLDVRLDGTVFIPDSASRVG